MFGAALGGVMSMVSNVIGGGNQGNGIGGGGLGGLISKFLDPLGLLGGEGQNKLSEDDKEWLTEKFEEIMAQFSEESDSACDCEESDSACDCEECSPVSDTSADNWQNIFISTGSGDDTVTIG